MPDRESNKQGRDTNPDPITGAPGSHPVGTGVGAAGGGATGAAIGAIAGPVGSAIGAVIGAVAGGLAGKGVAEVIDPTAEDAYWRENHTTQPFARSERPYESYAPAYRAGFEGFAHHGTEGHKFEDAEPHLRSRYEEYCQRNPGTIEGGSKGATPLAWDEARPAAQAAWTRAERGDAIRVPITEEHVKVGKREVEAGAVRIRKEVHTETVNTPVQLRREEVVVERVAKNDPGAVPADAFQSGEIRVPLSREEAVVEKTASVTGEVRVNKTAHTDTKNVQETIRKEDVKVENQGDARIQRDV